MPRPIRHRAITELSLNVNQESHRRMVKRLLNKFFEREVTAKEVSRFIDSMKEVNVNLYSKK